MAKIDEVLKYLGAPYQIKSIDHEPVIHRKFQNYEIEISGLHKRSLDCTIYIWSVSPRQLLGIYSGIKNVEDLKDLLGFCSVKYRNVLSRIRVEHEGQIE